MPDVIQSPPSIAGPGFYVGPDDNLRLTVYNALTAVRVTIAGRILNAQSLKVEGFVHEFTPTSDRVASVMTRRLTEGWLLNWHVYASNAAPLIGQTFAIASIVRGQTGFVDDLATLCAGYLTAKQRIAWPGGILQNSLEGAGAIRLVTGTNPGAGNEISETVPTGARWELISLSTLFTASATVANRTPALGIYDGVNNFHRIAMGTVITASAVANLTWAQGLALASAIPLVFQHAPIGVGVTLRAGDALRTVTTNIQVGDTYTSIQLLVREWLEGA